MGLGDSPEGFRESFGRRIPSLRPATQSMSPTLDLGRTRRATGCPSESNPDNKTASDFGSFGCAQPPDSNHGNTTASARSRLLRLNLFNHDPVKPIWKYLFP